MIRKHIKSGVVMANVGMGAGDLLHWPSSHPSACLRGSAGTTAAAKPLQSCPTLCSPMDCSSPGPSVHRRVSRQEYWSGLPCPPPGDLPNPGIEHRPPTLESGRSRPPCRGLDLPFPPGLLPPVFPDPSVGATEGRGGE